MPPSMNKLGPYSSNSTPTQTRNQMVQHIMGLGFSVSNKREAPPMLKGVFLDLLRVMTTYCVVYGNLGCSRYI